MKLTIKNILVWCAGLLAIVAFCMMFAPALKAPALMGGYTDMAAADVFFDKNVPAVASVIGYVLVLLAGLAAVAVSFIVKDAKVAKLATLAAAVVLVVGAIMVFCTKANAVNANISYLVKQGAKRADAKDLSKAAYENIKLAAGPVVAGIMAIISAGALAVSQLVKLDK